MAFNLKPILSYELLSTEVETRDVIVAKTSNQKLLSKIILYLNEKIPLESLSHLKRINSKLFDYLIIISPIKNQYFKDEKLEIKTTIDQYDESLKQFIDEYDLKNLSICPVATKLPKTREQFKKASQFWPINFHENKYITKCLNGTLFSLKEQSLIFDRMNETLDLLKTRKSCLKSSWCTNGDNCQSMSAIIVKNDRSLIVTRSISQTETNPLNHAVIVAINQVAEIHRKAKSSTTLINDNKDDLLEEYGNDYICTNYECFLSQDPCIMCAMALVHSRIKRVFIYRDTSTIQCGECNDQAFEKHKLHVMENLNHHYEVWIISPKEINSLPNKRFKSE